MKDFLTGFGVILGAGVIGYGLCIPLQEGLNNVSRFICAHTDRALMHYEDNLFPGEKIVCVERKYL
jgi:hypothetical protein